MIADASSLVVNGGTLTMGSNNDTVAGVQLLSGSITGTGTLTSNLTFDLQAGSVSASLGGNVGVNKTTAGTVTLSGTNSYAGNTYRQTGGTTRVDGLWSQALTEIQAGSFGGNGNISGPVINDGTVGIAGSHLTLNGPVSGSGSYAGIVDINNSFSPGPGANGQGIAAIDVTSADLIFRQSSSLNLELGGVNGQLVTDSITARSIDIQGAKLNLQRLASQPNFSPQQAFSQSVLLQTSSGSITGNFNQSIDGYTVSTFGSLNLSDNWYVDLVNNLTYNQYDSKRATSYNNANGTAINETASSQTDGWQNRTSLSSGYDIALKEWTFGLRGRKEQGAGLGMNMIIGDLDNESLSSSIGAMISHALSTPIGVLVSQVNVEWEHQWFNKNSLITTRFVDAPNNAFTTNSFIVDKDYINLCAGLSAQLPFGGSAFIQYYTTIGQEYVSRHAFNVGIRMEF